MHSDLKPWKNLKCYHDISIVIFGPGAGNILFAGATDGSVSTYLVLFNKLAIIIVIFTYISQPIIKNVSLAIQKTGILNLSFFHHKL